MAPKTKPTFAELLKRHRLTKRLSFGALACRASLYSKISPSYLVRLEGGERRPSRERTLALARGLELSARETDRLLESAGHVAMSKQGDAAPALKNPAVAAVLKILGDPKIPPQRKLRAQENIVSYVTWLHSELASSKRESRRPPRRRRTS